MRMRVCEGEDKDVGKSEDEDQCEEDEPYTEAFIGRCIHTYRRQTNIHTCIHPYRHGSSGATPHVQVDRKTGLLCPVADFFFPTPSCRSHDGPSKRYQLISVKNGR